jgi:hypothetical protein
MDVGGHMTECIPAPGKSGKYYARKELIKRDGQPPFKGAVCRHTCQNDSQAPNGFTCIIHTVWDTNSQNMIDCRHKLGWAVTPATPEQRAKSAAAKRGKTQKNKGRPLSPEHRARLSEAAKNRYNKEKQQ